MDIREFIMNYIKIKSINEYIKLHQITENNYTKKNDAVKCNLQTFLTYKNFYNYFVDYYYFSLRKVPISFNRMYLYI